MAYRFPHIHSQATSNASKTMQQTPTLPLPIFSVPPPPIPPPVSFITPIPPPVSFIIPPLPAVQQYPLPQWMPSQNPNSISIVNTNFPEFLNNSGKRDEDDMFWLKEWLSRKVQTSSGSIRPPTTLKIHQVKKYLKHCIHKFHQLKSMQRELLAKLSSMDSDSWEAAVKTIHHMSNELDMSLSIFENPQLVKELKKALLKRSKKRQSQKRRRLRHREMQVELNTRRQQLHRSIDSWLKDMQDALERTKTRESLKEEADSILLDVTRKKAEARRQLALLSALGKFHEVKMKTAEQQGQQISADYGIRFRKVTGHLQKLWEKQLKEYNLEEQGLRLMLSEAVDERDQTKVLREKRNLEQWEKVLFGDKQQKVPEFYSAAETDVEAFINIRCQWDKFIASTETPISSTIPVGWVLPAPPSSSQWEAILCSPESAEQ